MSLTDMFMIFPSPALSAAVWVIVLVLALYFARSPAHLALNSTSRILHKACRLAARAIGRAEQRLVLRNHEVLLAAGRVDSERIIEREFDRIDATIRKDMAEYPALHRKLTETVIKLEEDHKKSGEVPPSPPGWINAVEAVAKIPAQGDPMVGKVLDNIQKSLVDAHTTATDEYRKVSGQRHSLLNKMMPEWRSMEQELTRVDKNVKSLLDRGKVIDRHMDDYENIIKGTEQAQRTLSSSSLIQFFISAFVLTIAVGGAIINFNLIARPMSEMVGGGNTIGAFKIADIAALVIILVEISMGLFLMESLRITRLFPVISALPDKRRVQMIWVSFTILLSLACVEAGLAYMREILLQDELQTNAMLRDGGTAELDNSFLWITTTAQMGMGFILPFALVFVAIPLETFVSSTRTVLGICLVGLLRGLAGTLRVLGNVFRSLGNGLGHIYDMIIFLPLAIEGLVKGRAAARRGGSDTRMMRRAS